MYKASYLLNRRQRLKFHHNYMDKDSSTDSNVSLDSLDKSFKEKTKIQQKVSDDNVDTILVPFYEKDILIKVPKYRKRTESNVVRPNKREKKKEVSHTESYLMNNNDNFRSKRLTYLQMFRRQLSPDYVKKTNNEEIRSLSPEYGDTERESIEDVSHNPIPEFYNTESYNEIYYEKLLNKDIQIYLENSMDEGLQFTEKSNVDSPVLQNIQQDNDNLRSVSEVSRRAPRRAVLPLATQVIKLGGLGPDVEKVKPRLERARSLQRYSEKVRMENRLRIYKIAHTGQALEKKVTEPPVKHRNTVMEPRVSPADPKATYLINKTECAKIYKPKAKSADHQRCRERKIEKEQRNQQSASKKNEPERAEPKCNRKECKTDGVKNNGKTYVKDKCKYTAINTKEVIPPVQISFMVNVGGARPSSALKTLEEKHRMYQEQVKGFIDTTNI